VIGEGKENARWKLTDKGREYAHWLVKNGKKDEFLKTPFGGWGVPFTFEEARRQANH
jgi:hypothetical protein